MAKPPKKPKDPAKPTRAKAARPEAAATPDALADLLNPAINKGTAGLGSGTGEDSGLKPPPDNSFERRQDFSAAHTARKSQQGFGEAPQSDYTGSPISGPDPTLAKELGLGDEEPAAPTPKKEDPKYRLPRADLPTPGGAGIGRLRWTGQPAIARPAAARRPPRIRERRRLDAAPAAAAGQIRRRAALHDRLRVRAEGRPAAGDQKPGRGRRPPRPHASASGRHRIGQNLHHGQGDRGDAAPGADPGAEQDFGGAALRRVQVVLPRQRGGIFRQLLRLLPAGSLRAAHRHLYREGILDQRADRPHAPFGHARAARTRRRHHRRLGVLHLRHRLGRNLFGHDLHAQAEGADQPAPAHRRSGRLAIQAHAGRLLPRLVPRARRRHRNLPGALRRPRLASFTFWG